MTEKKKAPLRIGFEPMREKPIGFRVQLLNHSDTAAYATLTRNVTLFANYNIERNNIG